jgi:P27 family predicted phage terminase small subunit
LSLKNTPGELEIKGYSPAAQKRMLESRKEPDALEAGRPDAPEHFSEAERKVWDATMDMLEKRGTLTPGDGPALMLYVQTAVELRTERKLLDSEGRVVIVSKLDTHKCEIKIHAINPRVRIVRELEKQLLTCLREMGLTALRRHGVRRAREKHPLSAGEKILREAQEMFTPSRKRAN